ncbi:MAG: magnesium transporter, partial [Planctomycetales bacterium]
MMANTLYLPELREMLAERDESGLIEFCTAVHPAAAAEFMDGLSFQETWDVLRFADAMTRVEIFVFMDLAKQIGMVETLDRSEMAALIGELPPDDRVDILKETDS